MEARQAEEARGGVPGVGGRVAHCGNPVGGGAAAYRAACYRGAALLWELRAAAPWHLMQSFLPALWAPNPLPLLQATRGGGTACAQWCRRVPCSRQSSAAPASIRRRQAGRAKISSRQLQLQPQLTSAHPACTSWPWLAGWRACLPACSSPSPCCPVLPVPQAYEAQAQVTELSEEMELLRLKLDIAEQEKFEAQQRVAGAFGWWCLAGGPAGWGPAASGGCVCCACCHAFMAARARTQHISCGCSVCAVCE
jgi:hypothetical protein